MTKNLQSTTSHFLFETELISKSIHEYFLYSSCFEDVYDEEEYLL